MTPVGTLNGSGSHAAAQARALTEIVVEQRAEPGDHIVSAAGEKTLDNPAERRRTPRVSLIVVLPENHVVSPDRLAEGLRTRGHQPVDIVVACAGQPTNLVALQRSVGDAQFLLAPAGTSTEDLRELAMRQVPGDIVTLVSGALLRESSANTELSLTS